MPPWAELIRATLVLAPVITVDAAWNTNSEPGLPAPSRVSTPAADITKAPDAVQYTPGIRVMPARSASMLVPDKDARAEPASNLSIWHAADRDEVASYSWPHGCVKSPVAEATPGEIPASPVTTDPVAAKVIAVPEWRAKLAQLPNSARNVALAVDTSSAIDNVNRALMVGMWWWWLQ